MEHKNTARFIHNGRRAVCDSGHRVPVMAANRISAPVFFVKSCGQRAFPGAFAYGTGDRSPALLLFVGPLSRTPSDSGCRVVPVCFSSFLFFLAASEKEDRSPSRKVPGRGSRVSLLAAVQFLNERNDPCGTCVPFCVSRFTLGTARRGAMRLLAQKQKPLKSRGLADESW
jgi:hypothetical protein